MKIFVSAKNEINFCFSKGHRRLRAEYDLTFSERKICQVNIFNVNIQAGGVL